MDLIREYWWLIVDRRGARAGVRPAAPEAARAADRQRAGAAAHGQCSGPPEGRGHRRRSRCCDERRRPATFFDAPVHRELDGEQGARDDLCRLKGVGPKFADALHAARLQPVRADRRPHPDRNRAARRPARRLRAVGSPATASSSRPTISPAATPTASSRGSESSSRPPRPRSPPACCAGARRSACRSCGRPCRRSRTTSRRGGTSRPSRADA